MSLNVLPVYSFQFQPKLALSVINFLLDETAQGGTPIKLFTAVIYKFLY